jgi:DNA (cytosine-5)-methyltransferase 1
MSWIISNALMRDYENSLCLPEQAAESLEESSLDGEQSAPSNGNPTPLAFLPPDKMTAFSRLSRSGTTFAPLTEGLGEDVLTWFLAGFPARTSVAPEMARESTASEAASGLKCLGSLARWDRDTSLWRTHQFSLLGDLEPFSETWPRWGMMRGGECLELATLERPTSEKESGLWATPTASTDGPEPEGKTGRKLVTQVAMWPTPQAHKTTRSGEIVNADGTPWNGITKPHSKTSGRPITTALADAVALWPTPRSQDAKHGSCTDYELSRDKGKDLLHVAVERMRTWPTPVASMTKENQNPRTPGTKGSQTTLAIEAGGSLNPTWVEWLMGWPLGWTDLKPLETARFRQWCASHGKY